MKKVIKFLTCLMVLMLLLMSSSYAVYVDTEEDRKNRADSYEEAQNVESGNKYYSTYEEYLEDTKKEKQENLEEDEVIQDNEKSNENETTKEDDYVVQNLEVINSKLANSSTKNSDGKISFADVETDYVVSWHDVAMEKGYKLLNTLDGISTVGILAFITFYIIQLVHINKLIKTEEYSSISNYVKKCMNISLIFAVFMLFPVRYGNPILFIILMFVHIYHFLLNSKLKNVDEKVIIDANKFVYFQMIVGASSYELSNMGTIGHGLSCFDIIVMYVAYMIFAVISLLIVRLIFKIMKGKKLLLAIFILMIFVYNFSYMSIRDQFPNVHNILEHQNHQTTKLEEISEKLEKSLD